MKAVRLVAIVFCASIVFLYSVYAQNYLDCEGSDTEPCNVCEFDSATITIYAPNGEYSGPHNMTLSSSEGQCGVNDVIQEWMYDFGYTFCPVEGQYTAVLDLYTAGGGHESSEEFNLYYVDYDAEEGWCVCNGSTWISGENTCCGDDPGEYVIDTGAGTTCCGDQANEYVRMCEDNSEGYCEFSGEVCCSESDSCVDNSGACKLSGERINDWYCSGGVWHDDTPPVTSDDASDNATNVYSSGFDVHLTCEDQGSGCNSTYYCRYCTSDSPNCPPGYPVGDCTPQTQGLTVPVECPDVSECYIVVKYYSVDNIGNMETVKSSAIIHINTQLPTCTFTMQLPEYTNEQTLSLSWEGSDPGGGQIVSYTVEYKNDSQWIEFYRGSGTQTVFGVESDNKYEFRCIAENDAGETGISGSVTTYVDYNPPYGEIVKLPEFINETSFMVSWSCTDSGSGIGSCVIKYSIDDNPWNEWFTGAGSDSKQFGPEEPINVSEYDGSVIRFTINVTDLAGNSFEQESPYANVTIDLTAPRCELDELSMYQTSQTFEVSWMSPDQDVDKFNVEVSGDGENWVYLNDRAFYDSSELLDSFEGFDGNTYYFRCRAIDKAGNVGEWSDIIATTIDASPPDVQITYQTNLTLDEGVLNVSAIVKDIANITFVVLMFEDSVIDGVIEKINDNEWHVNWSIDIPLTAIGEQSFTLNVSDSNGNSDILIYNFTVSVCREGDVRPCGTDEGICEFGNSTCINGVWSECVGGRGPEDEVCNGLDDNCDGIIDNIGVDPYMNSSVEDTKCWCYGGNLPRDEICNDIDDDCDGSIDEGIICCQPGETRPCGTDVGICQKGYETCIDGSWSGVCEGGVQPRDEICFNNLDDDCDGVVDELIEFVQNQERPGCLCRNGETRPCGSDIGECVPGYMVCENNRYDPKKCIGAIGPSPEICDGKDNDCDGEIDEGCVKKLDPTEINEIIQRYLSGEDPESISADLGISQDTVLSYINCANGEMDPETEEGVDCGGICPASCFDFSWLWLSFVGVVILIVLFILMRYFKSRGEELTWEALKKKWSEGV